MRRTRFKMVRKKIFLGFLFIFLSGLKIYAKEIKPKKVSPFEPFKNGEQEHIKGNFEDARTWYRMVVKDFPKTDLACEERVERARLEIFKFI